MASQVEIINMALTRIGSSRITSINDTTSTGQIAKVVYNLTVDFCIGSFNWSSCTKRAVLSQLTEAPPFQYSKQYQLPTNPKFLKVLKIYTASNIEPEYKIEGDKMLTNSSNINLIYLARLTNSEEFGSFLTEVIVSRLALEFSYNQSGSATLQQRLLQYYENTLKNSMVLDGQQQYNNHTYTSNDITDSRY